MKPQGAGGTEPPADLRYREKWGPLDPNKPDGWTHSHLITEQIRQACGLMGGCWFALNDKPPDGIQSMLDSLNATTGWDVSLDELIDTGHRAIILQSVFGTQRGWIAEHDWQDVGPRFLEPIPDGKFKGFTIAKWLPDLVYEYYRISGRHEKTGRPYMDTLARLGLDEFKEWSQLD
jgi:aldehyde:ferredoxin oxidoreductase